MKNNKKNELSNSTSLYIGLSNNNSELRNYNKSINNFENGRLSLTKNNKKIFQNKNSNNNSNSKKNSLKNNYEINRTKSSPGNGKININDNILTKSTYQNKDKNDFLITNEDIINNFLLFMNDNNSPINKTIKENNPINMHPNTIQNEHLKKLNINQSPKIITPKIIKSNYLNKKNNLGSIKKITPIKAGGNHKSQKTLILDRKRNNYTLNDNNENNEKSSIIKSDETSKIFDTINNKSKTNQNSNKNLNINSNDNTIYKKKEKELKEENKDNDKIITKNKEKIQQKNISKVQIDLSNEKKNNEYIIKKYKLTNKEKAFLILSKSPVLILRYQLLFSRSTPSLRKALSTKDILDNYDNLFKLKIEELQNKISLCNKTLEEPFVASKTAEISLNFISTIDEAEFMYLSKLFKSKDNHYNESDIKYYYNFITIVYWLFNKKTEKSMKNIEREKMKLLMYNEAHKRGFSGIKDCLYQLFISNAKTVNQSIILVGENYNRIKNVIKKTPDMLKYHKSFGICKFTCFSLYLIKEILNYVEKMINTKNLKTKAQNLLNIVYYKYEIYQNNYQNKIKGE